MWWNPPHGGCVTEYRDLSSRDNLKSLDVALWAIANAPHAYRSPSDACMEMSSGRHEPLRTRKCLMVVKWQASQLRAMQLETCLVSGAENDEIRHA